MVTEYLNQVLGHKRIRVSYVPNDYVWGIFVADTLTIIFKVIQAPFYTGDTLVIG